MANHQPDRTARGSGAASFGLESMESRTLLSGGVWWHGAPMLPVSIRGGLPTPQGGETHVMIRRHEHRGEGFSFQSHNDDGPDRSYGQRRNGSFSAAPIRSPFTRPPVVMLPPWARLPREQPTPPQTPQSRPQSDGEEPVVEPDPVVTAGPQTPAEPRPSAPTALPDQSESTVTTLDGRTPASVVTTVATSIPATSTAMLQWIKSGAVYAADLAGIAPAAAVHAAAPAAAEAMDRVIETDSAILNTAVNVVSVPVKEFHIARLGSPLALMQDAIGSFIEESVGFSSDPPAAAPRRAWYVTLTVLTLDAALLTYYFQVRKPKPRRRIQTHTRRPLMLALTRQDR
jgi:hypothetical protein